MNEKSSQNFTQNTCRLLVDLLIKEETEIKKLVSDRLLASAFKNKYTLHPRKITHISEEGVNHLKDYLISYDEQQAYSNGRTLARTGLSCKSLLEFTITIRNYFLESVLMTHDPKEMFETCRIFDTFSKAYVSGFFEEMEQRILHDQEQLRLALATALENQRRELFVMDYAIDTSNTGIMIINQNDRITYVNPAFLSMWGYQSPEEIKGTSAAGFWGRAYKQEIDNALKKPGGWRGEINSKYIDGTPLDVAVSASIIRETGDKPIGTMAFFTDITEQKKIEKALAESEEKFRTLAESSPDPIVRCDRDGLTIYANPAAIKMFSSSIETIIGLNFAEMCFDDPLSKYCAAKIEHVFTNNHPEQFQIEYPTETGTLFLDCSLVAERNEQGEVRTVLGIYRDFTALKKAEEQILQDLKEKDVLLKEIHHRVKNNLNIVASLLNLQSDQIRTIEQAKEALYVSQSRIYTMSLVHENFYQSENLSEINMETYLESMMNELLNLYTNNHAVTLTMNVDRVSLDITKAVPCGLILNELVTNAIKHAFPNMAVGEITLSFTRAASNGYVFSVQDNGIGLPNSIDIENTETLGLQLIHILTQQLNGSLSVERSEGTIFTVTFPSER